MSARKNSDLKGRDGGVKRVDSERKGEKYPQIGYGRLDTMPKMVNNKTS